MLPFHNGHLFEVQVIDSIIDMQSLSVLFKFPVDQYFNNCMPLKNIHSEKEVVTWLKSKDIVAYNWLYDNYAPALYGMILKLVKDSGRTNAIMKAIFLHYRYNISNYDESKARLFTWMVQIAIKHCNEAGCLPKEAIVDKLFSEKSTNAA